MTSKSIGDDRVPVTGPDGKTKLVLDEKKLLKRRAVNRRYWKKDSVQVVPKGKIS